MKLIRRSEWGAEATSPTRRMATAQGVTIHWLGGPWRPDSHADCLAKVGQIRRAHLADTAENYADIAYNAMCCPHGYVIEARGAGRRPGANGTAALNSRSYAVCALLGTSGEPGEQLLQALADAVSWLRANGAGGRLWGHSDGVATACPGPDLLAWVRDGGPRPGGGGGTYVVRRGDTLSEIAAAHGTTVAAIAAANGIKDPDVLRVGQELRLPDGAAPGPAPSRPTVDLSRLITAARQDPPRSGTPVSYAGVRTVENALVAEGLLKRQLADGHYGTATRTAYVAWQRRCGYRGADADGIPGRASLQRLGAARGFDVTN